jgi:hypothetical protein
MADINASAPNLSIKDTSEGGASSAPLTPSEQLIKNAIKAEVLDYTKDDGTPGSIGVRRPDALAQFRIVEAAGASSSNGAYMDMINPLVYVGALDGTPEALPSTKTEIEAMLLRLGHAGQERLFGWYAINIIQPMMDSMGAAAKAEREKALLKN